MKHDVPLAKKVVEKIKALGAALSTIGTPEARAEYKRLAKAEKLYLEAAEAAGNTNLAKFISGERDEALTSINDENMHVSDKISFSRMNNLTLSENVDRVMKMTEDDVVKNNGTFVSIAKDTPAVILDNVKDAENLEIIMRFDAFYLATRHEGVLQGHYHNYGEIMKRLPDIISSPQAIVRLDNDRLNVISIIPNAKSDKGIVSIELNAVKDVITSYQKYNLIISVVPTKENYIRNLLEKRAVSVEYREEDLPQVNPQLYEWLAIVNDKSSVNSIPDSAEKVNTSDKKFNFHAEERM